MSKSRLVVLGLDGLAWSLARELAMGGVMPRFARLQAERPIIQMDSVIPTVSSVAWSCFATGRNPGRFGVYGFAELTRDFDLHIPDSRDLKCETIWERLAHAGKQVKAFSVPLTHPPRSIPDGWLVSCFLANALGPGEVAPSSALAFLRENGYEIDVDPTVAWKDRGQFLCDLERVLEGRRRTLGALLKRGDWDLLVLHIMETDRICHFLLADYRASETSPWGRAFSEFFGKVDELIGEAAEALPKDTALMILSDHGFCPVLKEVQLNRWLEEEGYLSLGTEVREKGFSAVLPGSRALAMVPGRIYLLTPERWVHGRVSSGEARALRAEIRGRLESLVDPSDGRRLVRHVFFPEELFRGPYVVHAPDLLIDPEDGYDFKAALTPGERFSHSPVTGMHTSYDAHLWFSEPLVCERKPSIVDVPHAVFGALGVEPPPDLDSRRLS